MPVAALPDLDVLYEIHGAGPPLLNIGGSGGDLRRTFPDRLPLNRSLTVLSFDQRGLGRSGTPPGPYSMQQYANDAAALVRSVGWDRCHVMGTSFGGMVALELAARHPELVDRMVLNCTSAGGESASYPLHELIGVPVDEVFATRMRLNDRRWDPASDEPIPGLGAYYAVMEEQAKAGPDPAAAHGLALQLGARAGHDVVDRLVGIAAPTLVCAGRYDEIAPLANSQFLVDRLKNAELRVFEGGHLFMLQDRSAYGAMAEFLAGGGGS